ncbi:MAG: T9SS type A sorting domain-containing protein [Bacteroidia bacterium]|nr:T9SS type A sorting domain-containing protein [Bacteroidia bacterium]
MKRRLLFILFVFVTSCIRAQQVLPFQEDFEGTSVFNIVNSTQTNKWVIGSATNNGGSKSMYISDNGGTSNNYNVNQPSVVHFYCDFVAPFTSCFQIDFDWKCMGQNNYDALRVYKTTTSVTPIAGQSVYQNDSVELLQLNYNSGTYQIASSPVSLYANETFRLIFSWQNDNSQGAQPPASIDNIFIYQSFGALNDQPCNAVPLTFGVPVSGDNYCTAKFDEPTVPTCINNFYEYEMNSVWYSFIAPASGNVKIRALSGSMIDPEMDLFMGTTNPVVCDSGQTLTYVACNSNAPGCLTITSPYSLINANNLVAGLYYYVRVDGSNNSTGTFEIEVIDGGVSGSNSFNPIPGSDCVVAFPLCSDSIYIPDPGFLSHGMICDFDSGYCVGSGERASRWYEITIANAGELMFDIVPNNYLSGFGADYDFVVWKIGPGGLVNTCNQIQSGSATVASCNYNAAGTTGCYTNGFSSPGYPGTIASYEPPINVLPGERYLLSVLNFSLSGSGCRIIFTNTAPGVIDFCPTGVNDIESFTNNLTLSPNPANGVVTISYYLQLEASTEISFVNVLGQPVLKSVFDFQPTGSHTSTHDISKLGKGIYFVSLKVKEHSIVKKLIIF